MPRPLSRRTCVTFRPGNCGPVTWQTAFSSQPDSVAVTTNGQEAYIAGIELDGSWRISPCWTLSGYLTWQDGEADRPAYIGGPILTEPVSRLSPLVGSVALRYDSPDDRWWVEGRVTAADKQVQEDAARADRDRKCKQARAINH